MEEGQAVELVLFEGEGRKGGLYVLDWEYDRDKDKILYVKMVQLGKWLIGHRDHSDYVIPKDDLTLYARDESGYISTTHRLECVPEEGRYYDEYGRAYSRTAGAVKLGDLETHLFPLVTVRRLGEDGIVNMIRGGAQSPE